MAKHSDATPAPAVEVSQEEQKELLEKLGSMTRKALRVIYEALVAQKLCYMCVGRPGEVQTPLKVDARGACVNCAGTGKVPDFERNKWAVNEVMARKLPMPKAIEMRVEDRTDKLALIKFFAGMKKDQVLEMERVWNREVDRISKLATVVEVEGLPDDHPATQPD